MITSILLLLTLLGSPDHAVIPGLVVAEDGAPIAGAEVFATRLNAANSGSEVFARLTSDAEGRFVLELPRAAVSAMLCRFVVVYAFVPGRAMGFAVVNSFMPPNGWPLEIVLERERDGVFAIALADGTPAAGVTMRPSMIGEQNRIIAPSAICDRLAIVSGADGRAVSTLLALADWVRFKLTLPDGASQDVDATEGERSARIQFVAMGRVEGRLVGAPREHLAGRRVWLVTRVTTARDGASVGAVDVVTDAAGRFSASIAAGLLSGSIVPDVEHPFGAWLPAATVTAGQSLTIEVPLDRATIVTGRIVEVASGNGVPGVAVLARGGLGQPLASDGDGAFATALLPGSYQLQVSSVPPPFLRVATAAQTIVVDRDGLAEITALPISLERGASVRGRVRDDSDAPVAEAWVQARAGESWPLLAVADANGEFTIEGLPRDAAVELRAALRDAVLPQPATVTAGATEPVTLVLSTAHMAAPQGRVVDAQGSPIARALVNVWESYDSSGFPVTRQATDGNRPQRLITDATGRFVAPRGLDTAHEYAIVASAPGFAPKRTGWARIAPDSATLPDVTLDALVSVSGTVVDAALHPLAGVRVLQSGDGPERSSTRTDEQGHFELRGFAGGPAFVIANQGDVWRGVAVQSPASDVKLVLTPLARLAPLPPPLARERELALARSLDDLGRMLADADEGRRLKRLEKLARIEPVAVLDAIDKEAVKDAWHRNYLRRAAIAGLDLEDGLAVAETMDDPQWRVTALLDCADRATESDRKLELIDAALVQANAIREPWQRAHSLAAVSERLRDLGEVERARETADAAVAVARKLNKAEMDGYARGCVAKALAPFDAAGARALIDGLADASEMGRHVGNMAHEVADVDPEQAERWLDAIAQSFQRDQYAPRVCFRMANRDLVRAKAIAARVSNPYQRAHAHAVMALAVHEDDVVEARALIRSAFAILEAGAQHEQLSNAFQNAAAVGAAMLAIVERVDAGMVQDCLWRTLALRLPWPNVATLGEPSGVFQRDPSIALGIARYDRGIAQHLLARPLQDPAAGDFSETRALIAALAMVDPERAVVLVRDFHPGNQANAALLARMLPEDLFSFFTLAPDQRVAKFEAMAVSLWAPDTED